MFEALNDGTGQSIQQGVMCKKLKLGDEGQAQAFVWYGWNSNIIISYEGMGLDSGCFH